MFDIGAAELLVIVIVAILVIGPSEMPRAMRTAGRWIGQVRKVSSHFRAGIDTMVREAELEDMEKKWKAQNEEIMRRSAVTSEAEAGEPVMTGPPPVDQVQGPDPEADDPAPSSPAAPSRSATDANSKTSPKPAPDAAPELPLDPNTRSKG
ncbi:twin-arginine translocase subunit TatB [Erythrobacter insulae]|uniref:Sec-independent protein translocase protein TatB n=1 Tax=Erythrobacter insulae TaxID=2584124 RepID=A0A547P9B9_9SPHN|nr:Sec-independent protein translocase protein TatB [Erythrobacter insulae]TRD10745.1 twin-arginine translocase subunit TatB [Erythrobacter insulae]